MKRSILLYGLAMALLLAMLKFLQFKFLVRDLGIEVYLSIIAVIFMVLGVWAGLKLTKPSKKQEELVSLNPEKALEELGLSQREFEVLQLMAKGFSNQEIADELFLSLNTIKSHSSNIFSKMDVKRRTQAIDKAKSLGILG
ncbi:MAG: LuxR C-terminal-related transcriptional regulator [Saprospiraceae bacterium]